MLSLSKSKSVVGLDVEAGSVAATEIHVNGHAEVGAHGVLSLDPGVFREGEVADPEALGLALKELFAEHKLPRAVRLGIANQRVAVRTLHLPVIEDDGELETAIRFQAQDHIPMPLDQAVLDWQVVGRGANEAGEQRIEVVVVAARRDMLNGAMDAMQRAGLRPVGIDHSAFGMIRALASDSNGSEGSAPVETEVAGQEEPAEEPAAAASPLATLYCNLGDVTNLAVARGTACLFTRVAAFGVEGIAQKLAERRQLTLEHARQWLGHVGLESPTEAIEGDPETVEAARECLSEGASKLADELRLSVEFYGAQEGAVPVAGVVACGPGTTIPGLVDRVQRDLGQPFEVGRPRALQHLDDGAAARLTLSYGLALGD